MVRVRAWLVVAAITLLATCTKPNPEYCDEPADCPGGYCDENHRCQLGDAAAFDGTTSDSGRADAEPQASFDVGLVSDWRIGSSVTTISEYRWVRVVNTGTTPLDLSTGSISNIAVDIPQVELAATWLDPTTVVLPGMSAGGLDADAASLIVTGGVVTEPAQDTASDLLRLQVASFPPPGSWIGFNVEITLQIENARAALMTRVVRSGTGANVTANAAARAVSSPVP